MRLFNKFLVLRRDGSVPEWPWLVMGAADPAVPGALHQYAMIARLHGMDSEYCSQIHTLAARMVQWREDNWTGDPDGEPHRVDKLEIVSRIPEYSTALPPEWQGRVTYLDGGESDVRNIR